jgi:uncharacterized protein
MTLASLDDRHLILFARYPVSGTTKTRLIPALGAAGAAHLAKGLTEYALTQAQALDCPLTVFGTGASIADLSAWLDVTCALQQDADLGVRMAAAFAHASGAGAARILLIGSDCPSLTTNILAQGFEALQHHDVVFGPAADGGYYLIGMRTVHPQLFDNMRWSHDQVLQQSLARLGDLSYTLLPLLHDIDTPDDLIHVPSGFLA